MTLFRFNIISRLSVQTSRVAQPGLFDVHQWQYKGKLKNKANRSRYYSEKSDERSLLKRRRRKIIIFPLGLGFVVSPSGPLDINECMTITFIADTVEKFATVKFRRHKRSNAEGSLRVLVMHKF